MAVAATSWTLPRRTATSRGEIAWEVFGEGPPVVLVHGTPGRSVLWRKVVPVLADRHAVGEFLEESPRR